MTVAPLSERSQGYLHGEATRTPRFARSAERFRPYFNDLELCGDGGGRDSRCPAKFRGSRRCRDGSDILVSALVNKGGVRRTDRHTEDVRRQFALCQRETGRNRKELRGNYFIPGQKDHRARTTIPKTQEIGVSRLQYVLAQRLVPPFPIMINMNYTNKGTVPARGPIFGGDVILPKTVFSESDIDATFVKIKEKLKDAESRNVDYETQREITSLIRLKVVQILHNQTLIDLFSKGLASIHSL
jgi:hypothetical protein